MNATLRERLNFGNLNLSTRVLFLIAGTTVLVMGTLLGIAIYLYVQDKVTYIYDLQDLKTERLTDSLRRALEKASLSATKSSIASETITNNPLEFNIPRLPEVTEVFLGEDKSNQLLLITRSGEKIRVAQASELEKLIPSLEGVQSVPEGELVYWISSFGTLISSSHRIPSSRKELAQRAAVSIFLRNNLVKGLVTVVDEKRRVVAGFKEVPGTNTALFIETPMSQAMNPVRRFFVVSLIVGMTLITLGIILSSYIFGYMWRPMRMVEWFTRLVAQGNYDVQVPYRRQNEIGRLFRYLENMAQDLKQREHQIIESETKRGLAEATSARLASAIEAAQSIQNQLIEKTSDLPPIPGLSIAARCIAAESCSGDWYGFHYDKEAGLLVGILVDVTGHGVGSALITAVTAGAVGATADVLQFMQYQSSMALTAPARLSILHSILDSTIARCGRKQVLASAFLFCFDTQTRKLSYLSAGHPAPFFFNSETGKVRMLSGASDLLGLGSPIEASKAIQEIDLQPNDLLLAYTDGYFENKPGHNPRASREFVKQLQFVANASDASSEGTLEHLIKAAGYNKIEQALPDDVTLIVMRGV